MVPPRRVLGSVFVPKEAGVLRRLGGLSCPWRIVIGVVIAMVWSTVLATGANADRPSTASWKSTNLDRSEGINAVACRTTQNCLAVGMAGSGIAPGGVILRSGDGGVTWTKALFPNSSGILFMGIACAARSICVTVGNVSAGGLGVIGVSTDGGRSWSQHHVPSAAVLYGASCASPAVCEVVGTSIRRTGFVVSTTDGGHSWHVQRPPRKSADLDAVSCPNTHSCVAVGDELPGGNESGAIGKEYGLIAVTRDGGRTWKSATVIHALLLDGVSCSTVKRCVVVGPASSPIEPSTPGIALVTKDGGATWLRASVPPGRYGFRAVSCIGDERCVAVGQGGSFPGYDGVLMTSSDGGEEWRQVSASGLSGTLLNDVSCVASRCMAGGTTTSRQSLILLGRM
jgi:photosystem II stability/assembly factor-like uncharacterized protein